MFKRALKPTLLILALAAAGTPAAAVTSEEILDRATANISSSKTISASFEASVAESESVGGSITLTGKMFKISTPQLQTWFDGRTQWSYSPQMQEVNVTEPTVEELLQINPFAIIANFRNAYVSSLQQAPQGQYRIVLTAKSSAQQIRKATLILDRTPLYPVEITLVSDKTITIKVSNVSSSAPLPKSSFRFDAKKHPGVEIVDLR